MAIWSDWLHIYTCKGLVHVLKMFSLLNLRWHDVYSISGIFLTFPREKLRHLETLQRMTSLGGIKHTCTDPLPVVADLQCVSGVATLTWKMLKHKEKWCNLLMTFLLSNCLLNITLVFVENVLLQKFIAIWVKTTRRWALSRDSGSVKFNWLSGAEISTWRLWITFHWFPIIINCCTLDYGGLQSERT